MNKIVQLFIKTLQKFKVKVKSFKLFTSFRISL